MCKWIWDFFLHSSQVVKGSGLPSASLTLNIGAPQWCAISPMMFKWSLPTIMILSFKFSDDVTITLSSPEVLQVVSISFLWIFIGQIVDVIKVDPLYFRTKSTSIASNKFTPSGYDDVTKIYLGSGDSSVVRAPNSWLKGHRFESWQENFPLQNLFVLFLILVYVSPPCCHSSTYKISAILPKVQVAVNVRAPNVGQGVGGFAWSDVAWCMVVWCTQNAPRQQQLHVAQTKQCGKFTTSVEVQNF